MTEKQLRGTGYALMRFHLGLEESLLLPPYGLLRLRREFSRILKGEKTEFPGSVTSRELLRPRLPTDPVMLRRVQLPAAGFVIRAEQGGEQHLRAGDILPLDVCFFGQGVQLIPAFAQILERLGSVGLQQNQGRFSLLSIADCDEKSVADVLWSGGPFTLAPRILDLSWLLESAPPEQVCFEFLSPARLLKNNRPLFRAGFADIFPFILRRVTGMLATWAELEDVFDVHALLESAASLTETQNRLVWRDWRPLGAKEGAGGLLGSVCLQGSQLAELWPLLQIGELFGLGKGASFGAGRYHLV